MTKTPKEMVENAKSRIRQIHVDDLHRALPSQPVILDVREPNEYLAGHIPGAVNIPRGVLEFNVSGYLQERDQPGMVYLYCRSGGRGALAADTMQELGYGEVCSVEGGFEAWKNAGLPVTTT